MHYLLAHPSCLAPSNDNKDIWQLLRMWDYVECESSLKYIYRKDKEVLKLSAEDERISKGKQNF